MSAPTGIVLDILEGQPFNFLGTFAQAFRPWPVAQESLPAFLMPLPAGLLPLLAGLGPLPVRLRPLPWASGLLMSGLY